MGGFYPPAPITLDSSVEPRPGAIALICRDCRQTYYPHEGILLNSRSEYCAFCYEWAILLMVAYKAKRRISPQIRARTLLNA